MKTNALFPITFERKATMPGEDPHVFLPSRRIGWYLRWPIWFIRDLTWPSPEVICWLWPLKVNMHMFRRMSTNETRLPLNYSSSFICSNIVHEKRFGEGVLFCASWLLHPRQLTPPHTTCYFIWTRDNCSNLMLLRPTRKTVFGSPLNFQANCQTVTLPTNP